MGSVDGSLRRGGAALVLAVLLCFAGIGSHSLWSPDEPLGASVGRTMLESGDLIVPHLNGQPFLEKPPLYWWVQVAAFHLLGLSPAVARLPSALFSALTLLVAFALGRRLGDRRLGLLTVVVLASIALFVEEAERVVVDPALAFFVALVHLGFVMLAVPRSKTERLGAMGLIALAVPLAFLSKGVVALGLAVAPPVLWLLATRRLQIVKDLALLALLGVPVFALFVAPWALALWRSAGFEALRECLLNNTAGRFLPTRQGTVYGHSQPFWYYVTTAPAVLLPWSLVLPAMLKAGVLRRSTDPTESEARVLLFSTCAIGVLLLSIASSKRELYLLPLLPAFSACVAWWLAGVGEQVAERSWDRPTLLTLFGLATVLPVLLWGAALVVKWAPPAGAALEPLQTGLTPARLALFSLVALGGSALLLVRMIRLRRMGLTADWIVLPFLVLFLAVITDIKALADPVKSLNDLTAAIAREIPGTTPVPAYLPSRVSNESLFGIIGFNLGRRTQPLTTPEELRTWFKQTPEARVILRSNEARELPPDLLRHLRLVYDETGRKAAPFAIAAWAAPGS